MLKVFFGKDTVQVRQAAFELLGKKESEGVTVTYIDADNYAEGVINDAVGASSLFGGEELYLIDTPSSKKEFDEEVKNNLEAIQESANTFVLVEEGLLAAPKKQYQKYSESLEEFKAESGERFNAFAMADALSRKDKKSFWLLLQEAKQTGLSEEEIIGTLWWQLKTLRLAASTNSANEAGMKDFPYNKAKRSLSNFKPGELEEKSRSLLSVYHDGHAGVVDIDLALEKWVLTL